jgi:glucose-6-phosphate isomerase
MEHEVAPFSQLLGAATGMVEPDGEVEVRRLSEMIEAFGDRAAADRLVASGDPIVYRTSGVPIPEGADQPGYRTTVLSPGAVGREYLMTKGHHHRLDRAEVYLGLTGSGLLVMQARDGAVRTEVLETHRIAYIPPGWAHRVVNTGEVDLVFLAVYFADSGQDYAAIERDGFAVRVLRGAGGPELTPSVPAEHA